MLLLYIYTQDYVVYTTIYNAVLTAAGVTTTRAAALQLTNTRTHTEITQQHSLRKPRPLTGTAYQRALHSHPMRQNSDKRTEGITKLKHIILQKIL